MEKTAGEDDPKLIKAADDTRAGFELTRLRLMDRESGIPEVVRSDGAAVGVRVADSTWISEEPAVAAPDGTEKPRPRLDVDDVALEERKGPSPSDSEIAEATVFVPETPGVGSTLKVGNVPVRIDVAPAGSMLSEATVAGVGRVFPKPGDDWHLSAMPDTEEASWGSPRYRQDHQPSIDMSMRMC